MYGWETTPDKLTPHFLAALLKWQSQGARSVKIEIAKHSLEESGNVTVWCYCFQATEGRYVTKITEIPTTKQLLQMKQDSIDRQRAELEKKLNKLEGKG